MGYPSRDSPEFLFLVRKFIFLDCSYRILRFEFLFLIFLLGFFSRFPFSRLFFLESRILLCKTGFLRILFFEVLRIFFLHPCRFLVPGSSLADSPIPFHDFLSRNLNSWNLLDTDFHRIRFLEILFFGIFFLGLLIIEIPFFGNPLL